MEVESISLKKIDIVYRMWSTMNGSTCRQNACKKLQLQGYQLYSTMLRRIPMRCCHRRSASDFDIVLGKFKLFYKYIYMKVTRIFWNLPRKSCCWRWLAGGIAALRICMRKGMLSVASSSKWTRNMQKLCHRPLSSRSSHTKCRTPSWRNGSPLADGTAVDSGHWSGWLRQRLSFWRGNASRLILSKYTIQPTSHYSALDSWSYVTRFRW